MKPLSTAVVQSLATGPALPQMFPQTPSSALADIAAGLLDELSCALFVVDRSRRVHFVNAAGEEILRKGSPLRRQDGQLSTGPHMRPLLNLAIAAVLHDPGITHDRPRHLILEDDGGVPRAAYVRTLPCSGDGSTRSLALVALPVPGEITERCADAFAQMYGLTRTEQRVLVLMVNGATMKSAAAALNIAAATVTTHLKHIFDKTGVRRQSEIVSLFLRSLPPTLR